MNRGSKIAGLMIAIALLTVGLAPGVHALLQRPTPTVTGGATSGGTAAAFLIDSDGTLHTTAGSTTAVQPVAPSATYKTLTISGITTIPVGSTVTVLSAATYVNALTITNTIAAGGASITVNVMDGSGNYIFPQNFVIAAGQSVGAPLGAGLLYSGVGASASIAGAKINAGGYQ